MKVSRFQKQITLFFWRKQKHSNLLLKISDLKLSTCCIKYTIITKYRHFCAFFEIKRFLSLVLLFKVVKLFWTFLYILALNFATVMFLTFALTTAFDDTTGMSESRKIWGGTVFWMGFYADIFLGIKMLQWNKSLRSFISNFW